jgi:hypothetical protein
MSDTGLREKRDALIEALHLGEMRPEDDFHWEFVPDEKRVDLYKLRWRRNVYLFAECSDVSLERRRIPRQAGEEIDFAPPSGGQRGCANVPSSGGLKRSRREHGKTN